MSINLPQPIQAYFNADGADSEAVASCFTEQAVVKDEERTHVGLDAIKKWVAASASEYTFISEPFSSEDKDGKTVVTSKVTGTFPGSPIVLRYFFELEGDKIKTLEIMV